MDEILVLTTTDSLELARQIASALVEAGEAACVNLISGIRSIYRWEGKTCDESEVILLIKTTTDRFDDVQSTIKRLHIYRVPEVVAVPIKYGDPDYLIWLREQVRRSS